jgi:hypothetical protein
MKRLILLSLILLSGCTMVSPDPGVEAVLVSKPIIFGHGGIDPAPVKTGRTIVAITTDAWYVDMKPQQKDLKVEDMMSSDGVPLHFDAIIRYRVTDSVKLMTKFGPKYYENNVQQEFFNQIRQQIRQHGMNDMAINTQAVGGGGSECRQGHARVLQESRSAAGTDRGYRRLRTGKPCSSRPPNLCSWSRSKCSGKLAPTAKTARHPEQRRDHADCSRAVKEGFTRKINRAYMKLLALTV